MSPSIAKFEWDVDLIGFFDPRGLSNRNQTPDVQLFVDQVAYMASAIGPQVVQENLRNCLGGIALRWYSLPEVQSYGTSGHGIEHWIAILLQRFDTKDASKTWGTSVQELDQYATTTRESI